MVCEVTKYKGKWSVFLYKPRVFMCIGTGKKNCEKVAAYLNRSCRENENLYKC